MQNYTDTILAQYANSPTLTALIADFNQWIDPSADIDLFFQVVWNINTAQGYGLDVWGKIVNMSRNVKITQAITNFGFNEAFTTATASTGVQPFGQASFYDGPPATTVYTLSDDSYRTLIYVKAMANLTNCTASSLNAMLKYLFAGRGRAYVQDTGDMTLRFVFEFLLTPVEIGIMTNSGAIARPAGVQASIVTYSAASTFGFSEGMGQPFGQGTFFTSANIQTAI